MAAGWPFPGSARSAAPLAGPLGHATADLPYFPYPYTGHFGHQNGHKVRKVERQGPMRQDRHILPGSAARGPGPRRTHPVREDPRLQAVTWPKPGFNGEERCGRPGEGRETCRAGLAL